MSVFSWLRGNKSAVGHPAKQQRGPRAIQPTPTVIPRAKLVTAQQSSTDSPKAFTLPVGRFRFIALDVETSNSSVSSICQIGFACVRYDGTMHVDSTLIDPE